MDVAVSSKVWMLQFATSTEANATFKMQHSLPVILTSVDDHSSDGEAFASAHCHATLATHTLATLATHTLATLATHTLSTLATHALATLATHTLATLAMSLTPNPASEKGTFACHRRFVGTTHHVSAWSHVSLSVPPADAKGTL